MWDYPRPPALEPSDSHIEVRLGGATVCSTTAAYRVLETSHPPTFYVPPADIVSGVLGPAGGGSVCEWKGAARYFDVVAGGLRAERAAWDYPHPTGRFEAIAGFVSFYPALVECFVDGIAVDPQPGGFYGGWITPDVVGPFKGEPGTMWW